MMMIRGTPRIQALCFRDAASRQLSPLLSGLRWGNPFSFVAAAKSSTDRAVSTRRFYNNTSPKNDSSSSSHKQQKKRLDVAIVGMPNAGKSQLLNVLTQTTVAAVSRKRHTTREGILGARTIFLDDSATQLLFVCW